MKDRQYPEITHTINDTNVTQPRSEQEGRLVLLESVTATATADEAVFSQYVKRAARKSNSLSQDKPKSSESVMLYQEVACSSTTMTQLQ